MTSQINPQDINGEYPVAGQPNNTKGFRDNFTNTKTNFEYAANEITELQNKAVLKQALTGGAPDNNMNDVLIYAAKIQDFSATSVQIATTSGLVSIDYTAGHYQRVSTTGNIQLGFSNWPANNSAGWVRVAINITDVAHTVTLPNTVTNGLVGLQGYSAGVITFVATGTYSFDFVTYDNGNNIDIQDLNRPLSYYTNAVSIASSTNSVSTTTGALTVSGGVGVSGNLNVAGNIVSAGNIFGTFIGNIPFANISVTGNITANNNVIANGNITANGSVTASSATFETLTVTNSGHVRADIVGSVFADDSSTIINAIDGSVTASSATFETLTVTNSGHVRADIVGSVFADDSSTIINAIDGSVTASSLQSLGSVISSSATAGIGYTTGAGGAVTQDTNRTTEVTLNTVSGAITLVSAAGSTSWQSFTVTNSAVAATDVVIVNQQSGTDLYEIHITAVAAGSFRISYKTTGGTTTEQPVFNFAVIKAVTG